MLNPMKGNDMVNHKGCNSGKTTESGNFCCNQTEAKAVIVTLPKPLIQVQFLVGTPLQIPRFHWVFSTFTVSEKIQTRGVFLQFSSNRSPNGAWTWG